MNEDSLIECDFDDPASVVSAYIASMNKWELESWKAMRAVRDTENPASYQEDVLKNMNRIFDYYCTKKERKYGRLGSFQKPPEYDLTSETILFTDVENEKKKAIVETERQAILGSGRYQYVLYRKENKWLIDNLKHNNSGVWEKAIL